MAGVSVEDRSAIIGGPFIDMTSALSQGRSLCPAEQVFAFQSDLSPRPVSESARFSSPRRYELFGPNKDPKLGSYIYGLYFLPERPNRDAIIYLRTHPSATARSHDLIARAAMDLEADQRGACPLREGELSLNGAVVSETREESFVPDSDEALRQVLQTHFQGYELAIDGNIPSDL